MFRDVQRRPGCVVVMQRPKGKIHSMLSMMAAKRNTSKTCQKRKQRRNGNSEAKTTKRKRNEISVQTLAMWNVKAAVWYLSNLAQSSCADTRGVSVSHRPTQQVNVHVDRWVDHVCCHQACPRPDHCKSLQLAGALSKPKSTKPTKSDIR